ncbi:CBBY-like protein isoform X2 [Tripterygium wilfordii]|uniref:CBBY-like protein isoform X2 n=1 Tax=Tripterygium wilfordii TaxID=458696 RepID=UPI0018F800FD|nr:CBBY-like protein isoform X2 [Tripterygium wilfordii]
MASTIVSLPFAALPSSSNAFLTRAKGSLLVSLSRERSLTSSQWGTKICVNKARIGRGMIKRSASSGVACSSSSPSVLPSALLFDCDGVLVDTEKDGHRISFNDTFEEKGLGVTWDVDLYGELLKIGGGKERMTAYFNKTGWPENTPKSEEERKEFIASLHKRKTELFMALIEKRLLPLRPGVAKLIDQALEKGVKVAVCSTSNEKAVSAIVSCLLGPERAEKIKIFAGDVVPHKKPDPAIYLLAAETLAVDPSSYTADEDFLNADAIFDFIGDPPEERFDLAFCGSLLEKQYVS